MPFDFARNVSFNPVGTVQSLAIFLGAGVVMMISLLMIFRLSQVMKLVFGLGALLFSVILVFVNFSFIWLGILLASILLISWQFMHTMRSMGKDSSGAGMPVSMPRFGLPMLMIIVVSVLYFIEPPISTIVELPTEVRPSLMATGGIAKQSMSEGSKEVVFGSGASTFLYEYLKYRPSELNATAFWGVRFLQGFSTMTTLIVTIGIAGVGSLLVAMGYFIISAFRGIAKLSNKKAPSEKVALVSFASFLFLFFFWFVYPVNFAIMLFTFLFAGLVIASLRLGGVMQEMEFSFVSSPQRSFLGSLAIIVGIVALVVGGYWQIETYLASAFHSMGVQAYNKQGDVDGAMEKVRIAVRLDEKNDVYWRTFTQLLGLQAQQILANSGLGSTDLQQRYQIALQSLIEASQKATKANNRDPLNWRQLAQVYESNIQIVGGAEKFAIQNYSKAAEANPQNPQEYLNLARAYVLSADNYQQQITRFSGTPQATREQIDILVAEKEQMLSKALEHLQKAIVLKRDYTPAHFLTSQVYERQGERNLAIQKNLEARNLDPRDTGVGYQLGLLYYLDNQIENARLEFERVVGLDENFSNARYFLGLAYDRLGATDRAIQQFERISELNPNNQEVQRILTNLKGGDSALTEIAPLPQERIEPPIEEDEGGEKVEDLISRENGVEDTTEEDSEEEGANGEE